MHTDVPPEKMQWGVDAFLDRQALRVTDGGAVEVALM